MKYRALPPGAPTKRFSTLGLGLGGIQQAPAAEIRQVIETAIAHGINFFDFCAGAAKTYAPFCQAIRGRREQVFFQLHLGAVYNESGEHGWSRELSEIQRTFAWELETLGTDYADFGFLHCVDDLADIDALEKNGILEFAQSMRRPGPATPLPPAITASSPSTLPPAFPAGIAPPAVPSAWTSPPAWKRSPAISPEPEELMLLKELSPACVPALRPCLEALAQHHNRVSVHFAGSPPGSFRALSEVTP